MRRNDKDWLQYDEETLERSPKFEKMKRRADKTGDHRKLNTDFEVSEKFNPKDFSQDAFVARVVEVHKRYVFVSSESTPGVVDTRDVWLATIAKKFLQSKRTQRNFVTVGDRVICTPVSQEEMGITSELPPCVIQKYFARTSLLARKDPADPHGGLTHIIASNVDQLVIVASYLYPTIKWGLIDRYLVLAHEQGIHPIIVLNKKDLLASCEDKAFVEDCLHYEKHYRELGYDVFSTSFISKAGVKTATKQLAERLDGKISLLSGHSGVGKSSLLNLLKPEITQMVEPNDDIFYKGRHTTSFSSFIKLGTGGYLIDTPGVRSLVLQEFSFDQLMQAFPEMAPLAGRCQFRECRHISEPGCVVRDAVEQGTIAKSRYKSYLNILIKQTDREGRPSRLID